MNEAEDTDQNFLIKFHIAVLYSMFYICSVRIANVSNDISVLSPEVGKHIQLMRDYHSWKKRGIWGIKKLEHNRCELSEKVSLIQLVLQLFTIVNF